MAAVSLPPLPQFLFSGTGLSSSHYCPFIYILFSPLSASRALIARSSPAIIFSAGKIFSFKRKKSFQISEQLACYRFEREMTGTCLPTTGTESTSNSGRNRRIQILGNPPPPPTSSRFFFKKSNRWILIFLKSKADIFRKQRTHASMRNSGIRL